MRGNGRKPAWMATDVAAPCMGSRIGINGIDWGESMALIGGESSALIGGIIGIDSYPPSYAGQAYSWRRVLFLRKTG